MKSIIVFLGLAVISCSPGAEDPQEVLWEAVTWKESRGQVFKYNRGEEAVGIAQIRPCLVADLNRIAGHQKWSLEDRWDPEKSRAMFWEYTGYWIRRFDLRDTAEARARIWNGGPRGYQKESTLNYWKAVERRMAR